MFGGSRRHKAHPPPLTRETANPNAATAAASAFMRRDTRSPSLSSAAAAAALRARPTTPTNVAEVQSKRVVRRSASMSSTAGRGRGAPRPEIRRAPSNSSMTERTFRTPSPSPSRSSTILRRGDVPPVPSLPQSDQSRERGPVHKKTTSLQTQPFRTASQKMKDGGGTWFGAAAIHDTTNVRTSDAVMHQSAPLDDRSGSTSPSVNFSYPRGVLESPTGSQRRSSVLSEHTLVYDANSRRMVPQGELFVRQQAVNEHQHAVQAASEKPVKKKKQDLSRSGSHLAKGTVGRTKSVQVDSSPTPAPTPASAPAPAPAPALKPPPEPTSEVKEPVRAAPTASEPQQPATVSHDDVDHTDNEAESIQPEKVAVDELELRDCQDDSHEPVLAEPDDDVLRQRQAALDTLEQPRERSVDLTTSPTAGSEPAKNTRLESPTPRKRESVSVSPAPLESRQGDSIRRSRVQSASPARTARFATASDHLVVKHEPPPRSLSPRKSALKHSSSRPMTPSDDSSDASGPRSALAKEDSVSRKKSVRVSFNDRDTVVVGEAAEPQAPASPVIPSPQVKKSWASLIGRHKKDTISLDEDETMTPRPALPAFGSVREKKPRELDERPLVRPSERNRSPSATSKPAAIGTAVSPEPEESLSGDLGSSNDHAVGAILAHDSASRNEANTSKYREPLPPIVTSVEHSGYISNSPMSSDNEDELDTSRNTDRDSQEYTQASESFTPETTQELDATRPEPAAAEPVVSLPLAAATNGDDRLSDSQSAGSRETVSHARTDPLPIISVSGATPIAKDEEQSPRREYFGVPGGFPEDDTSESSPHDVVSPLHESPASLPTAVERAKPAPITPIKAYEVEPSTPSPQMDKIQEEKESSDGSEVFSDAYEDLSELEGDGFLSLDAVLTTPVKSKMSQKLFEQSIAQQKKSKPDPTPSSTVPMESVAPKTADEWEQAKVYWKSLTADKRRQLELEAMEEAGEEADFEGTQKTKKAKKRRSMDKATLEAYPHPDRTYQIQPGTKWQQEREAHPAPAKQSTGLKKSMRGETPVAAENGRSQGGSMRKSLRSNDTAASNPTRSSLRQDIGAESGGGGLGMRRSMRTKEDSVTRRQNGQADRPVSYNPATSTNHTKLHKRTQSYDESPAASSAGTRPPMRRRGSDSSESSFRRARVGNMGAPGGLAFRSTMRGSMREPQRRSTAEVPNRSSRFSLRSLSPTPFRRGSTTSPPPPSLGNRMRPSLRSGNSSDGSTSRLSIFGRSNNKKPTPRVAKASRFGDSSDEEDVRPAFSSRFADSSDEENGPPARPASRGMSKTLRTSQPARTVPVVPKGPIRSDSPDLPDSDDELTQPKRGAAAAPARQIGSLHRSGSGRGSLASPAAASTSVAPGSSQVARPSHQRRGSFMSSILRRKKDPGSKISRDISESAARRDTALERSTEQLVVMRSNSGGRLQKKGPNWPFPEDDDANDANDRRPATATAAMASTPALGRPALLQRRTMSTQMVATGFDSTAPADLPPLGPPKKKKFGALRKMFGIND